MEKTVILKVLVGSQAHLLADENSDSDYRAVYVLPTKEILSLNHRYKGSSWIEGDEDNTAYEIGHFLHLATKCNPTIMEVFKAPVIEANEDGHALRKLFPHVWNTHNLFNAWTGYGFNQRKKFLDDKDSRAAKYAVAWVRTLINLVEFFERNNWTVDIGKTKRWGPTLKRYKRGDYTKGEIIDIAERLYNIAQKTSENLSKKETNYNKVNDFLLTIRKNYW